VFSVAILVAGLGYGALFATSALSLSVTYRASRVLNLAQGAVALMAGCLFARFDLPGPLAAVGAIGVAVGLGLVLEATTRNEDALARLTSVVGWLLALSGVVQVISKNLQPRYPLGHGTVRVLGVALGYDTLVLIALGIAAPIGLGWVLRNTAAGAQAVAVADAPEAAEMLGLDVLRTRRVIWVGSQAMVAMVGILAAPTLGFSPVVSLQLLAGGLAAALLGGLDRMSGPAVVGFALGLLRASLGGHMSPALADGLLVSIVVGALALRRASVGGPAEARV
jgi:branched-subunit amino acid ABC-type transport system permease component